MKPLAHIIGSTFGIGYFPLAPGTAGSFVTITILWFLPALTPLLWVIVLPSFFFIGVWAATICEQDWGHDPGRVVWDEVVGMMIAVYMMPKQWPIYASAFVLFRFFDILKPFPVHQSQKLPKGWGVMVDDVIAGIYAFIICHILFGLIFKSLTGC
ncbi:phosphatidylglycerophosphatase A [candidate division KSB1 bacterium]|nr:phosphatidylglycerophosphatase A [candidate division KSB1 bacterium]RQW05150.1 MAG: phosphatidylglycerophosphatase A [candidate division KSB1 bacterium]